MEKLYDHETTMKYGKYQGSLLSDLPPQYLLWLHENNKAHGAVRQYIVDNISEIRMKCAYEGVNLNGCPDWAISKRDYLKRKLSR